MSYTRSPLALLFLIAIYVVNIPATNGQNRDRELSVVTYNMYLGAELSDIFGAADGSQLVAEVAEAYSDMLASNVPPRADAVARQIEAARPALVGLQEVALWRTGAVFDPAPAETVAIDQLELLLAALRARGLHYEPVAIQTNLDAELPAVFGVNAALDIRLTDRVVLLARTDLRTSDMQIERTETGTFANLLPVSSPAIGTIFIRRGWASADVKMRGKSYRFITAHLESFFEPIQNAQAAELLQGPANTRRNVILAGDINSDAAAAGISYSMFTTAGFSDAWVASGSQSPGMTWPLSAELPSVILSPTQRIDVIMFRGNLNISGAELLGESDPGDNTSSGMRPSDHAGLGASFVLQP